MRVYQNTTRFAAHAQRHKDMYAYAINIWGNGSHTCSALKLGTFLKERDPTSMRIAVTQSTQPLDLFKLWDVHFFQENILNLKQWLITAKIFFWSLTNVSMVMYLDLDLILNLQATQLRRLWNYAEARLPVDNLMAPLSGRKCLNGGVNIFRPNQDTYRRLFRNIQTSPIKNTFAYRCPAHDTDQYYLNQAFRKFVNLPRSLRYHTSKRRCVSDARKIHILHFFGRFMPWHSQCRSCLQKGGFCSFHNASACRSVWEFQKTYWVQNPHPFCDQIITPVRKDMRCISI